MRASFRRQDLALSDFAALIAPAASKLVEPLCRQSQALLHNVSESNSAFSRRLSFQ